MAVLTVGLREAPFVSLVALVILAACSGSNGTTPSSATTLNAGPRKAAPDGLYGKKWKSRPTSDLKLFAPPSDGVAIYVPKGSPAAFQGIPVAEADLEYDRGRLWSGDLYIDGADRREAVTNALLKLYGSPDSEPSTGNDYSWSWPEQRIAVDVRFDAAHARTTVAFESATKNRSTEGVPAVGSSSAASSGDAASSASAETPAHKQNFEAIPTDLARIYNTLRDQSGVQCGTVTGTRNGTTVCGSVNAHNGFGGYTGMQHFIFNEAVGDPGVPPGGAYVHWQGRAGFAREWKKLCTGDPDAVSIDGQAVAGDVEALAPMARESSN